MEERLIELETKLSFQDKTLQELIDIITAQQQQIDQLSKYIATIAGHLQDMDIPIKTK